MIARYLTTDEEKTLIKTILTNPDVHIIGSGAARICYGVPEGTLNFMGINDECVVKVAIGIAGQNQCRNEINAYNEIGDCMLAKIFAFGQYVEVMEKVRPIGCNFRDYVDYAFPLYEGDYEDEEEEFAERENEIFNDYVRWNSSLYDHEDFADFTNYELICLANQALITAWDLSEYFGETGDNGQLGLRSFKKDQFGNYDIVCYDYGFVYDSDDELCSHIADWIEGEENYYLTEILSLLDGNYASMEELEHNINDHYADGDYE